VICSPYVGREGTQVLAARLTASFRRCGSITFITDLSPANVCQRSTDPSALRHLGDHAAITTVRHLPGVHAKVYIADERVAIVTSANLTAGGLYRNFEYGVELRSDALLTGEIKRDVLEYGALGADVPPDQLDVYCQAAEELHSLFDEQRRSIRREIRRRFEQSFRNAEDSLIRIRLAVGPIHTVFARTIEYLLRSRGPMTTEHMHPMIKMIHPDLCDDSVDRVIDGKRFGKKWKHAVRTAQQQLKKRGVVRYEDHLWRLR
jgi:phosphatidylserine/phosphatidylglycerophosphate/cardiolipin synthase-like enzyme